MADASINDLLPTLQVEVPGAPPNLLLDALRKAWRALCVQAEAWRSGGKLTLLEGVNLYTVPLGELNVADVDVTRLDGVWALDAADNLGSELDTGSYALEFHYDETAGKNLAKIRFYTAPAGGELRWVRFVLVPTVTSTAFDMATIGPHADTIQAKATAELLLLPRKWRDGKRAEWKLIEWRRGKQAVRKAALVARHGDTQLTV
ncbi:MAG: hypothetical protein NTY53_17010 [Kiritimatiellaeota bacterium]|nr:hypothetical protein [Kiritimatiellota bacterium]